MGSSSIVGMATFLRQVYLLPRWLSVLMDVLPILPIAGEAGGLVAWRRYSSGRGQWIPVAGRMPVVRIARPSPELLALLAIGATTHVGSHAALGLGRYVLVGCAEEGAAGRASGG